MINENLRNIIKTVLTEESQKKLLNEIGGWDRFKSGDQGYWAILYNTLKKGGIPVKLQYTNDPIKSTYMWWGSWIIYKDFNKNGGYPISFTTEGKNNYLFKFKDSESIYRGQTTLDKILLDSKCINYYYRMNNPLFTLDQSKVTIALFNDLKKQKKSDFSCTMSYAFFQADHDIAISKKTEKEAKSAWDSTLGPFLEKNKPPSTTYFKGRTQQSLTYKSGQGLQFRSDGTIFYPKNGVKDATPTKYGTWSWDSKTGKPIVKNLNGQKLDIAQVMYHPYEQFISGDLASEKLADQIFLDLTRAFDYDNDGDWMDYDRTNETLAMNAINRISSKEVLEKLNAKIAAGKFPQIKNVEQWFKMEMSDWDPSEWDSIATKLNSLGYSVPKSGVVGKIYGYTVGGAINMVDKSITSVEDNFNYANKQTAVRRYTLPQALQILQNDVSPKVDFLAEVILNSSRWYNDDETIVAKAFSRINSPQRYNQIKIIMKQDPMDFVKTFLSTKQIQKPVSDKIPSIFASYTNIFAEKLSIPGIDPNSKDFTSKIQNNLLFRTDNPRGTNDKYINTNTETNIFKILQNENSKDPNVKGDVATVPKDFGWNVNPNIYPYPKPYPLEWINAYKKLIGQLNAESKIIKLTPKQKIIEDIVKKYKKILISEEGGAVAAYDPEKEEKRKRLEAQKKADEEKFKPVKIMQDWNNELARQRSLIPKYCSTPLKIKETAWGKQRVPQVGVSDVSQETKTHSISMYTLCKDYGGLWIQGAATNSYKCSCRDYKSPLFGKLVVQRTAPKEWAEKDITYTNTVVDIGEAIDWQQSSTDWTDPKSWLNVTKEVVSWTTIAASIFFPAAAPLITVIGGVSQMAFSISEKDPTGAAIALFFTILPELKVLNVEKAVLKSVGTKLIGGKGAGLTAKEVKTLFGIMQQEKLIANKIMDGVGISAAEINKVAAKKIVKGMTQKEINEIIAARATKALAKEVGKQGTEATGINKAKVTVEKITDKALTAVKTTQQSSSRTV
jgi:hypothetical protein